MEETISSNQGENPVNLDEAHPEVFAQVQEVVHEAALEPVRAVLDRTPGTAGGTAYDATLTVDVRLAHVDHVVADFVQPLRGFSLDENGLTEMFTGQVPKNYTAHAAQAITGDVQRICAEAGLGEVRVIFRSTEDRSRIRAAVRKAIR